MGLFSGANEAELRGGRSPRISEYPGKHVVKVIALKSGVGQGPKTKGKAFFAEEMEVVKSSNPTCAVGTRVSWVTMKSPAWPDYFFSDVKRCLGSITGKPAESITEANMELAVDAKQPAAGKLHGIQCYPAIKDGKTYADVSFFAANEKTDLGPTMSVAAAPAPGVSTSTGPGVSYPPAAAEDADLLFA